MNKILLLVSVVFVLSVASCATTTTFHTLTVSDSTALAQQNLEFVGVFAYRVSNTVTGKEASNDDFYMQALKQARAEFGDDVDIVDLNVSSVISSNAFIGNSSSMAFLISGRVVKIVQ